MMRPTVLLADDHAVLLDGLTNLLRRDFNIIGTARDGRGIVDLARKQPPEVIVMDISMPSINGMEAMRILRDEGCSSRILFLTMHTDLVLVEEALRAGASGFVLKNCDTSEFVTAIQLVANGTTYVTPLLAGDLVSSLLKNGPRGTSNETLSVVQRKILQFLSEGKTMKEAGNILGIPTRAAELHKYEIMRQLGVETSAALIRYAVRVKLV